MASSPRAEELNIEIHARVGVYMHTGRLRSDVVRRVGPRTSSPEHHPDQQDGSAIPSLALVWCVSRDICPSLLSFVFCLHGFEPSTSSELKLGRFCGSSQYILPSSVGLDEAWLWTVRPPGVSSAVRDSGPLQDIDTVVPPVLPELCAHSLVGGRTFCPA